MVNNMYSSLQVTSDVSYPTYTSHVYININTINRIFIYIVHNSYVFLYFTYVCIPIICSYPCN